MSENKNIVLFTRLMSEFLESGVSISTALKIISQMKGASTEVKKAALEIHSMLEMGYDFSLALKNCSVIQFSYQYVSFVKASQESGQLDKTFDFLLKREREAKEKREKLFMTSIYPLIVLVFAIGGSVLLYFFGDKLVVDISGTFDKSIFRKNAFEGIIQANLFLLTCILGFFLFYKRNNDKNLQMDFFNVVSFMTSSGLDLFNSFKLALPLVDKNEGIKRKVIVSMVEMEKGLPLAKVLERFGSDLSAFVEMAEVSGSMSKAFIQYTNLWERRKKKRDKLFENLLEPVLMAVLALYLIILLMKVLGPVMFNLKI